MFCLAVLISAKDDVNCFIMVQMRVCYDHNKLCDSVDLFNLFQSLAFEDVEPISRDVKAIGKYKIANAKFKSSKKKFIKLRVNGKFYLKKSIFSISIIVFMF